MGWLELCPAAGDACFSINMLSLALGVAFARITESAALRWGTSRPCWIPKGAFEPRARPSSEMSGNSSSSAFSPSSLLIVKEFEARVAPTVIFVFGPFVGKAVSLFAPSFRLSPLFLFMPGWPNASPAKVIGGASLSRFRSDVCVSFCASILDVFGLRAFFDSRRSGQANLIMLSGISHCTLSICTYGFLRASSMVSFTPHVSRSVAFGTTEPMRKETLERSICPDSLVQTSLTNSNFSSSTPDPGPACSLLTTSMRTTQRMYSWTPKLNLRVMICLRLR